jgi:hypothetical protein
MSPEDQATAFSQDLAKLIDRYAQEFELNYATIIGVLQMHQTVLSLEAVASGDVDK